MSKCKYCGSESFRLHKSGYCDDCRATFRSVKTQYIELGNQGKQATALTDLEKSTALASALDLEEDLRSYKKRGAPLDYSEAQASVDAMRKKCGVLPTARKINAQTIILSSLCIFLAILSFCCAIILAKTNDTVNDLRMSIINKDAEIQQLNDKIALLGPVEKQSFTLSSGNFVSGVDFAAGTYDIKATSGLGNVSSDNAYNGGINAIMGIASEDMFNIAENEYQNIVLPDGTTLTIDGVKIRLTLKK